MIMVFTLVSGLQDKLGEVLENLKRQKEEEVKRKEEQQRREEEVKICNTLSRVDDLHNVMQARFRGTIVTKESFLEWRKKFEEEMNLQLESKDNYSTQSTRLTGTDNAYIYIVHELCCMLMSNKLDMITINF